MHEHVIQGRIWFVCALLFLSFIRLATKLTDLHLSDHSKITGREYKRKLLGSRGRIFDRNGEQFPMAISLPARQFFLDPKMIRKDHDPTKLSRIVAECLELDYNDTLVKFQRTDSRYIPLGNSTEDDVFAILSDKNSISGIGYEDITLRRYPQGRRMAHILGFVNNLGIGSAGIEQQFNSFLAGTHGMIEGEKDAWRKEIPARRKVDISPISGANVFLTLDHNIQYEVENALREGVEKFNATAGWAIVQEIKTGAILAMISLPDFEPENYTTASADVWRNNALAIVYEPGSIMKAVTVAAALNERIVTPDTVMNAGEGSWFYCGKVLRDHVTGRVTISTALKKSSNVVCAKLGLELGNRRLEAYLRAFNFGSKLGIELPGEENGILAPAKSWDRLKPTRIPIGQGIAVTGLQMINAFSTLANDGVMMRPYIVDRVVSPTGEEVFRSKPKVIGRPVRPEVARAVRSMLTGVTEEGTGRRAQVEGFSVAGKTGTAQLAIPGGYSNTDYDASFVGFVPASNPVFSVLVTIERPRPQHTGGYVAAPVFSRIASATVRYLELLPDMLNDDATDIVRSNR